MSTTNEDPAPDPTLSGPAAAPTERESPPSRTPLDQTALRAALIRPGALWQDLTVVTSTGSTNTDLATRATQPAQTAPEGAVLIAEEQRQGRGRMGRRWVSPPRSALMFSVLLRPAEVPPARRGWVPLLAGVAAATAVRRVTGVPATLKWPNDLLVADRKLAGILAEQSGDAIVVGLGINVSTTLAELPEPATGGALPASQGGLPATSLWLEHATSVDRAALLTELLGEFERWYQAWRRADPPGDPERSGLRRAYLDLSATVGRDVRVERPGGQVTAGRAVGLDPDGQLIIESPPAPESPQAPQAPRRREAVSAGDVRHLR